MAKVKVKLGLEVLLSECSKALGKARVGLLCNQASVTHELQHVADVLRAQGARLTTLFGPQHGIRGEVQDNMIETPHTIDASTGLPIYSLYSETRDPSPEMLAETDIIVCDLQDVGCRIYTFIYTLAHCMKAARALGKKVIVCDRPNPINGLQIEGNILETEWASFVGEYPLPVRHGLTIGELALLFNEEYGIGCELEVIQMRGWERSYWWDDTGLPWVLPSPNMPTLDTATIFPGTVFLEGTQMSEGRGTTKPFELVGAPYIEAQEYAAALNSFDLPGVWARACGFQPTFQKHAGRNCGGVQLHITDRNALRPVETGLAVVQQAYRMYPQEFKWKEPPYEYVFDKNPFDVIAGSGSLRQELTSNVKLSEITASWKSSLQAFEKLRERYFLY